MEKEQINRSLDHLYELLPVIYQQRDAEQGYPLKGLLQVIDEQVTHLEQDMDQLYRNWFIETCDEWVVPYIGELIGYRPIHTVDELPDPHDSRAAARQKILFPRREVANTIQFRRRKGTLYLLELLANQVAGWPARAVEYIPLLAVTQSMKHLRLNQGRTVDVRQGQMLKKLGTPFDPVAHSVNVRRPNSTTQPGYYNVPDVGLFVWRLQVFPVTHTPAYCLENVNPRCYTFSVLSNDQPLYTRTIPERSETTIAEESNLPLLISSRLFEIFDDAGNSAANPNYYGADKSMAIWVPEWHGNDAETAVSIDHIVPADLTDWHYQPKKGKIAVDPQLGRLAFHPRDLPKKGVWVSYYYGLPMALGGGEYKRPLSQPVTATVYRVGQADEWPYKTIGNALKAANPPDTQTQASAPPQDVVIEIQDSAVYLENLKITLRDNQKSLQIRAANGAKPIIRLLDWHTAGPDALWIGCENSRGCVILDGLLIAGRGLQIEGEIEQVIIRHSTLVPGWWLDQDCEPGRAAEPSCELINTSTRLIIDHSIVGSLVVNLDQVAQAPMSIELRDSILDATSATLEALSAPGCQIAHAAFTAVRSTIIGEIHTHSIPLAENSIFNGCVKVARRQQGCMRFCTVTPGSRTPRRYRCQPDLVVQAVDTTDPDQREEAIKLEQERVEPQFNSRRYGSPTYCQLAQTCASEIRTGADDESEMGVYHDLYQPQRLANLEARLAEYAPAGMDAGIVIAS